MSPTEKLIQIRLLASGPIRNPTPRATLMKIRRLIDEPEATTVFETEALRVKPSLALAEKYGCSPSLAASFQEALDRAAAELANPSPPKNTHPWYTKHISPPKDDPVSPVVKVHGG